MHSKKNDAIIRVLFFGGNLSRVERALEDLDRITNSKIEAHVIVDKQSTAARTFNNYKGEFNLYYENIRTDENAVAKVIKKIPRIDAAICTKELIIPMYSKQIENLLKNNRELSVPDRNALEVATNKSAQRKILSSKMKEYTVISKTVNKKNVLKEAKELLRLSSKVILKPINEYSSRFVVTAENNDIHEKVKLFTENYVKDDDTKTFILEEFIEGKQYSVDGYIDILGNVVVCPIVRNIPAKEIGEKGWYGAIQYCPTKINLEATELKDSVAKIVRCFGLTSTTFHLEFKVDEKNKNQFKFIELGARPGGFRDVLYQESYGFNHLRNDLINKLNFKNKLIIHNKAVKKTAVIKHYARKPGNFVAVKNLEILSKYFDQSEFNYRKQKGDSVSTADLGGTQVLEVIVSTSISGEILKNAIEVHRSLETIVE